MIQWKKTTSIMAKNYKPCQNSGITLVTLWSRFHGPFLGNHQPRFEAFVHGHLGFLGLRKSLVEPILYSVDLLDSGIAEVFEEQILSPPSPLSRSPNLPSGASAAVEPVPSFSDGSVNGLS